MEVRVFSTAPGFRRGGSLSPLAGRVEDGRGVAAAQRPGSRPRSSNQRCGFPASGSPTGFRAGFPGWRRRGFEARGCRVRRTRFRTGIGGCRASSSRCRSTRKARTRSTTCRLTARYARAQLPQRKEPCQPRKRRLTWFRTVGQGALLPWSGKGEPGFRRRWPGAAAIGQDEPGDDRDRAKRLGEPRIGVGEGVEQFARLPGAGAVAHQQRQQHLRRGPVGFGKIDVEGNDRGAGLGELFDELGDDRPRPWPLPDRGEAVVVDIDDRDRRIRRRSRRHALIEIEGDQRQPTQEIGGEDPGRRRRQQECQRQRSDREAVELRKPAHRLSAIGEGWLRGAVVPASSPTAGTVSRIDAARSLGFSVERRRRACDERDRIHERRFSLPAASGQGKNRRRRPTIPSHQWLAAVWRRPAGNFFRCRGSRQGSGREADRALRYRHIQYHN